MLEDDDYKLLYKTSKGHTPYMMHPYDDKMVYMADLVPTLAHIQPAWVMGYDISPGISAVEKQEIYPWIQSKKLTMIFEHDTAFWGAKITDCTGKIKTEDYSTSKALVEKVLFER